MSYIDFNLKQKRVFLSIADALVNADGVLTVEEERYFLSICNDINLMPVDMVDYKTVNLSEIFDSTKSKKSLLVQLMYLAYSDSEFHEREGDLINFICNDLSLDSKIFEEAKELVENISKINEKLQKFIEN